MRQACLRWLRVCSRRVAAMLLLVSALCAIARAADHKPPAVEPATNFPAVEVHAAEQVAIAAEPYNTARQARLFRAGYLAHGFLPVRVMITNTGDQAISLKDARILFITARGDRLQAASAEDMERRMAAVRGSSMPMPSPIPGLHLPHKDVSKAIERDMDTLGFQSLIVKPHTTEAGFLFYDVDGLPEPLKGAALNLHSLRYANGKELFYFEIPFDKYLASHGNQMN